MSTEPTNTLIKLPDTNQLTHRSFLMKPENTKLTESDFIELITRGAARLTPSDAHRLVAEMPDLREQFTRLRDSGYPEAERQLWFLSHIVEQVWTDQYREMPYGAALEAAFAITYFLRESDLIPDSIGPIGLVDDIAVGQAVLLRNAVTYEVFRAATHLDRADFALSPRR
ncbi:MAG: YkvA family protein [Terrimicrobiaceae bacterium]